MSQYNSFVPTVEFTPLTEDEIQEVLYEGVQADTRMQDALRIISKNLIIALEPRLSNYTHNLTAEMAGHMDAAFSWPLSVDQVSFGENSHQFGVGK